MPSFFGTQQYGSQHPTAGPNPLGAVLKEAPEVIAKLLVDNMNPDKMASVFAEVVKAWDKQVFSSWWDRTPRSLKALTLQCSKGVATDHSGMSREERMHHCCRLNDLRLERCLPLAKPDQRHWYKEKSWTIIPRSLQVKSYFWDQWCKIPTSSESASKWAAVLKYLDSCPEKPSNQSDLRRHVGSSVLSDHHSDKRGCDALEFLAAGFPAKNPGRSTTIRPMTSSRCGCGGRLPPTLWNWMLLRYVSMTGTVCADARILPRLWPH